MLDRLTLKTRLTGQRAKERIVTKRRGGVQWETTEGDGERDMKDRLVSVPTGRLWPTFLFIYFFMRARVCKRETL